MATRRVRVLPLVAVLGLAPAVTGCEKGEPPPDAFSGPTPEVGTYPGPDTVHAPTSQDSEEAPRRALFGPDRRPAHSAPAPARPGESPPPEHDADSQPAPIAPFLPLADAVEGEWALYAAMDSRAVRYEITRVTTTTVMTRVTVRDHGKPLGLPAVRQDPRALDPVARQADAVTADRRPIDAIIEAAGRPWNATLYEDRWTDEEIRYLRRTWVSPQVPVFGMIRMELYGDDVMEAKLELIAAGGNQ